MQPPRAKENRPALVRALAARQAGVIGLGQVSNLGLTRAEVRTHLRKGDWKRVHRGVFRMVAAPETLEQRAWAAVLWAGDDAVVSHHTAARILGLDVAPPPGLDLTVAKSHLQTRGIRVHRAILQPVERTTVRGLPTTSVIRTLLDLAAVCTPDELERAFASALRMRGVDLNGLKSRFNHLAGKGVRGAQALRRLLFSTDESTRTRAPSALEVRVLQTLRKAGLPPPAREYVVQDATRWAAQVDFAYPAAKLAIEADSLLFHHGRERFERDRQRLAALAALGWRVIPVTWQELRESPERFVCRVREALGLAGREEHEGPQLTFALESPPLTYRLYVP